MQNFLAVSVLVTSTSVFPQDPYVAWGDARIVEIRRQMRERMSPAEAELERSISYRVVDSGGVNAVAVPIWTNGHREILVSSSLLWLIDSIVTLETVSVLWNKIDCISSYLDYIQSTINSNGVLALEGHEGSHLQAPFPFMTSHPSICPKVSPDVIDNNVRQADSIRSAVILQSIKWVLLHEFAHHLHRDVHSNRDFASDRDQERNADSYATVAMLHPPEDPIQAAGVILLFCSLEGFRTDSQKGDHPTGVERLKAMVDASRSSPVFQGVLHQATASQRARIEAGLDALEKLSAGVPSQ